MADDLRGRPEHLARFSDETAPDTWTTGRRKVPVYATVNRIALLLLRFSNLCSP